MNYTILTGLLFLSGKVMNQFSLIEVAREVLFSNLYAGYPDCHYR